MKLGIQNVDWAYVGARLAQSGDDSQARFFKAFLKECSSWGTRFQVEQQLACVNQKLTPEERAAIGMLGYEEVTG